MTIATVPAFDATHDNIGTLPAGKQAAGYATGSASIIWTPADWQAHPGAVRIDQDAGASDPTADVLDVETRAATPAEVASWTSRALADYDQFKRPGQRRPAIYVNLSNITAVANALVAAKLTDIGLWIARPGLSEAEAVAMVENASGPFPIIGVQFAFGNTFDSDIFSQPWLTTVSKDPNPPVTPRVPPGQWLDARTWTWRTATLTGEGLDGNQHEFSYDTSTGGWVRKS